jgi:hypothetical protein
MMGVGNGPDTLHAFALHRLWADELQMNMLERAALPWDLVEEYDVYLQLLVQKRHLDQQPKGAPHGR